MQNNDATLADVFKAFDKYIHSSIKVASCGIIKSINSNKIGTKSITNYNVSLFPISTTEKEIVINCYSLDSLSLQVNDAVLVIFTDRQNKQSIANMNVVVSVINDSHSLSNGIIIGKLNTGKED